MAIRERKKFFSFDCVVAVLSVVIAIFLITMAYNAPKSNIRQIVGPEVMPIGVLSLIIVCAIFIFINSINQKKRSTHSKESDVAQPTFEGYKQYKTVVLIVIGLLVYGTILDPVGFIISTTLLVLWSAYLFEKGKWVRNVVVSLLFSISVYYCFVHVLDVMLPPGLINW